MSGFEVEGRTISVGSQLELELPYPYGCGSTGSMSVNTVSSDWTIDSF